MTVKQRIRALRLLEKQKRHPEYMKQIGVEIKIKNTSDKDYE